MNARLEGMSLSEEREIIEIRGMGNKMRDIDGDVSMEDDSIIRKQIPFAKKSSLKFKGRLMKVTKQVDTLGTNQEEVDSMAEEASGSQSDHEEHHDQDGVEVKMESGRSQENVLVRKMMNGLETGIALQDDFRQGIKYCPDMEDIILPVYTPVSYKPGFSGNKGRAEQIHQPQTCEKVCSLCMDGPRCKYSNVKEKFSAESINAPSAIGYTAVHTD